MVDMPEQATLYAQDVPIFKGKLGTSRGKYAVQIEDKIKVTRPQSTPVAEPVVTDPLREKQK